MLVRTVGWSFVAMALAGAIAAIMDRPFIFPSLGPTALMIFAHPRASASAPRHVILGHALGAAAGYFALFVTGLLGVGYSSHVTTPRILAAATALALTALLLIVTRSEHPPAGATTLIVALGVLPKLIDFVWLMIAVVVLVVLGLAAQRLTREGGAHS